MRPNNIASMKEANITIMQHDRSCRKLSRRTLILIAVAIVFVLGLAIGLGVGLGLKNSSGGESAPEPTSSAPPYTPPTNTTNGTLWQPAVNGSWQIILLDPIALDSDATSVSPDVDVYDIDLFTNTNSTISTLHNLGKRVICYFSAGSYEPDRPDSSDFQPADLGKGLDGWPGEKWLNIRSANVRRIMAARIELASQKGCDAVDPDNVDGYDNDNGLGLTTSDSIDYMTFITTQAAKYNISTGLKNAGKIVLNITSLVQFSVNEQCVQYGECDDFAPFIEAGKPVFHIEYPNGSPNNIQTNTAQHLCSSTGDAPGSNSFSTVLKNMDLDGWVRYCDGSTANTSLSIS